MIKKKLLYSFNLAIFALLLLLFSPAYFEFWGMQGERFSAIIGVALPSFLGIFGVTPFMMLCQSHFGGLIDSFLFATQITYYILGGLLAIVLMRESKKKKSEGLDLISGWVSLGYCFLSLPYTLFYLFSPIHGGLFTKSYLIVYLVLIVLLTVLAVLKTVGYQMEKKRSTNE